MRWIIVLGLAILVALSLPSPVAAGDAPETGPAATTQASLAPLAAAVQHAPLGTRAILFADWAAIKAETGFEAVTSSSTPIDNRIEAVLEMTRSLQPLAMFAFAQFPTHADVWGWDSTDLDWEASFVVDGPPVAVLRFRDGFDLAPVREAYEERGFTAEAYGDATILSHEMDLGADWLRGSDFGVLNTAFLDDDRTLVLSSGLDGVTQSLDARSGDGAHTKEAKLIAEALGSPLTAGIDVETDACLAYDPRWLPGREESPNQELLQAVGTLRAWEGLGMGIDSAERGRFVLAYATPEEAAADLEDRVRLAEQGVSLVSGEPYADGAFGVLGSMVERSAIQLNVQPVDGRADRLSQAFITRDLPFAACG